LDDLSIFPNIKERHHSIEPSIITVKRI
jgi:hypothetical protein